MIRAALLLVFAAAGAAAAGPSGQVVTECDPYAALAREIMQNRQAGIPMRKVMEVVGKTPETAYVRTLVVEAYDQPAYVTEPHQARAVTEFENKAYSACIKGQVRR